MKSATEVVRDAIQAEKAKKEAVPTNETLLEGLQALSERLGSTFAFNQSAARSETGGKKQVIKLNMTEENESDFNENIEIIVEKGKITLVDHPSLMSDGRSWDARNSSRGAKKVLKAVTGIAVRQGLVR